MAQSDHQDLVHQFIAEKQRFVKSLAALFKVLMLVTMPWHWANLVVLQEWDTSKDGEITLTEFEVPLKTV
eukprot:3368220-Amphidinium_carterae.1